MAWARGVHSAAGGQTRSLGRGECLSWGGCVWDLLSLVYVEAGAGDRIAGRVFWGQEESDGEGQRDGDAEGDGRSGQEREERSMNWSEVCSFAQGNNGVVVAQLEPYGCVYIILKLV